MNGSTSSMEDCPSLLLRSSPTRGSVLSSTDSRGYPEFVYYIMNANTEQFYKDNVLGNYGLLLSLVRGVVCVFGMT